MTFLKISRVLAGKPGGRVYIAGAAWRGAATREIPGAFPSLLDWDAAVTQLAENSVPVSYHRKLPGIYGPVIIAGAFWINLQKFLENFSARYFCIAVSEKPAETFGEFCRPKSEIFLRLFLGTGSVPGRSLWEACHAAGIWYPGRRRKETVLWVLDSSAFRGDLFPGKEFRTGELLAMPPDIPVNCGLPPIITFFDCRRFCALSISREGWKHRLK